MAHIKGCNHDGCIANKKKIKYSSSDEYCSKCGQALCYVCPKCYTPLPDDSEKYCVRCLAEKADAKERRNKVLAAAGTGVLGVGAVVVTKGKDFIKYIPKIK